jgi:uncharacterized membrane protein YjfL (UPF0719 family)
MMPEFELSSLVAGLVAYGIAVLAAVLTVFVIFKLNVRMTGWLDEEELLLRGHRSAAIALGATLLAQAVLMRHAVFPAMAVVRDLLLARISLAALLWVLGQCVLFFVVIAALSFGSVLLAGWLFTRMTRKIPEQQEIRNDNVAVAIFYAFALLAMTIVVNEGIEDLSRSIIPYGRTGVIRLP